MQRSAVDHIRACWLFPRRHLYSVEAYVTSRRPEISLVGFPDQGVWVAGSYMIVYSLSPTTLADVVVYVTKSTTIS